MEALGVAVYTTDAQGRLTAFNEAAASLWGWRPPLGDAPWCGSWRLRRPLPVQPDLGRSPERRAALTVETGEIMSLACW